MFQIRAAAGWRRARALAVATVVTLAAVAAAPTPVAAAVNTGYTGALSVSATNIAVGTPITVTETATNLTGTQVPFITVGIRRLGFSVTAVVRPRTGICRIAGSATTFQVQGWTTQPTAGGGPGVLYTVIVTVH